MRGSYIWRPRNAETFGVYMEPSNKKLAQGICKGLKELEEEGALKKIPEEQGMPTVGIGIKPPVGALTRAPGPRGQEKHAVDFGEKLLRERPGVSKRVRHRAPG